MSFESFNLDPIISANVRTMGYVTPTPIQRQCIEPSLEGRDVLGLAQTGTGKTAAFVLPILHRLMQFSRGTTRALIIAPTRELVEQTNQVIGVLGQRTRLRSATIYGGVSMRPQIQHLRNGTEIIAACPGRLLDHIHQGTIRLDGVEIFVIDEADRMFDMGFLPDVRRILKHLPAKRQTLLFLATMSDDVMRLSREILHDPVRVRIGHSMPAVTVSHALYPVNAHLKTPLLIKLLQHTDTQSVLVFTRTKRRAKNVAAKLENADFKVTSLQGNLSQNKRKAALDGFRRGKYQILVATDLAARGIDVSGISHVINYDIPDTADAYTHRIGRTGRGANTGDAFTLITEEDRGTIRAIERVMRTTLERRRLDDFDYKAPAPVSQVVPGRRFHASGQQARGRPHGRTGNQSRYRHATPAHHG